MIVVKIRGKACTGLAVALAAFGIGFSLRPVATPAPVPPPCWTDDA